MLKVNCSLKAALQNGFNDHLYMLRGTNLYMYIYIFFTLEKLLSFQKVSPLLEFFL